MNAIEYVHIVSPYSTFQIFEMVYVQVTSSVVVQWTKTKKPHQRRNE